MLTVNQSNQNWPPSFPSNKSSHTFILKDITTQPSRNDTPLNIRPSNIKRIKTQESLPPILLTIFLPYPTVSLSPSITIVLLLKPGILPVKRQKPPPLMN